MVRGGAPRDSGGRLHVGRAAAPMLSPWCCVAGRLMQSGASLDVFGLQLLIRSVMSVGGVVCVPDLPPYHQVRAAYCCIGVASAPRCRWSVISLHHDLTFLGATHAIICTSNFAERISECHGSAMPDRVRFFFAPVCRSAPRSAQRPAIVANYFVAVRMCVWSGPMNATFISVAAVFRLHA